VNLGSDATCEVRTSSAPKDRVEVSEERFSPPENVHTLRPRSSGSATVNNLRIYIGLEARRLGRPLHKVKRVFTRL